MIKTLITALMSLFVGASAWAQNADLSRHNLMYAGESKNPRVFIVKDGSYKPLVQPGPDATPDVIRIKSGDEGF